MSNGHTVDLGLIPPKDLVILWMWDRKVVPEGLFRHFLVENRDVGGGDPPPES